MINLQRAFLAFWSQFDVPAYLDGYAVEHTPQGVPTAPNMPYITFNIARSDFFNDTIVNARIWTRSTSFAPVLGIVEQIETEIPTTGKLLKLDNNEGAIMLRRGNPFFQYQPPEPDDQLIKIGYIILEARYYVI